MDNTNNRIPVLQYNFRADAMLHSKSNKSANSSRPLTPTKDSATTK